MDARVVGEHLIAVRAVAEEADECGMFALDNLDDAAFGAAVVAAAGDAGEDFVAVHGVADAVAADEEIAFNAWNRLVGHDEAVAVAMGDHAAGNQIRVGGSLRAARRRAFFLLHRRRAFFCGARGLF